MRRPEFFDALSSATAWISAAFLLISGVLHTSAAQAEDTNYAKIGWWAINYRELENVNGCYAAASFKDQTLISLDLVQTDKGKAWLMVILNPAWNSWIKNKKQHIS